ncbi:MAG: hypothetical protein JSV88_13820 [Candidatus Aminicenantes bacterium]|nr:MAG: hypothetical protein JSV88_13820 [Candidatus Aminicenantes bacterium]
MRNIARHLSNISQQLRQKQNTFLRMHQKGFQVVQGIFHVSQGVCQMDLKQIHPAQGKKQMKKRLGNIAQGKIYPAQGLRHLAQPLSNLSQLLCDEQNLRLRMVS